MFSLMKREFIEFYKREPTAVALNIVILVFIFATMFPVFNQFSEPLFRKFLAIVFPISVIILCSGFHSMRQFYKDRLEGRFEVFLGLGKTPFEIWFSKSLVLGIMLICMYLIGILLSSAFVLINNKSIFLFTWTPNEIFIFLFLSPLTGIFITSFQGFILMVTNKIEVVRFVSFFVFLGIFFVLGKAKSLVSLFNIKMSLVVACMIIVMLFCFFVPYAVLKRSKKDIFLS